MVSLNMIPLLLKPKSVLEPISPGVTAFRVTRSPLTARVWVMVWERNPSQVLWVRITSLRCPLQEGGALVRIIHRS